MKNLSRGRHPFTVALLMIALLIATYYGLSTSGILDYMSTPEAFRDFVLSLGFWGPLLIVATMTAAIVVSPLPSAPIALAAGLAYGHTIGTLYVLIGAELGALVAFLIARVGGRSFVERWVGPTTLARLEGSQGTLMAIVFVTRLMPFISFDAVSYAAGLTPLTLPRFALATLAGILPASFLLAHFGAELGSDDANRVTWVLLALGLAVLIPLSVQLFRRCRGGPERS